MHRIKSQKLSKILRSCMQETLGVAPRNIHRSHKSHINKVYYQHTAAGGNKNNIIAVIFKIIVITEVCPMITNNIAQQYTTVTTNLHKQG